MERFRIHIVFLLICLSSISYAQQDPQFNQYFFNPLSVNPAYAGSRGGLSAVAVHRSQWVGFEGAPTTQAFAVHAPSRDKKMGYGFQLMNDQIGPKNTISMSGIYAYKVKLYHGKLGFGLRASLFNYVFDWSLINFEDQATSRGSLNGKETYLTPSFDFGVYYHDKLNYIGVEFTHLNQGKLGIQSDNVNLASASRQHAQAIIMAGRAFEINSFLTLKPSMLIKTANNLPAFIDLNGSLLIKKKYWVGLSYRRGFGAVLVTEYILNKAFRIGYSFDMSLTTLSRANGGSHEIFIGYDLNLFKSRVVSPRYF